ncbi:MAG: hypothetical protein RIQ81_2421 [Pseudomonadota bacterium]
MILGDTTNTCGFVLAAGFGTRLRPITDVIPKPLVPFFGVPLLDLALFRLKSTGIVDIAANAHYLAGKIAEHLEQSPWGRRVHLSIEDGEILGRGGAYIPLRTWFGNRTIVAYNGDVISDIDVSAALEEHRRSGAVATMVVLPAPLGRDNAVFCDPSGRVGAIAKAAPDGSGKWTARGFACLQILEPEFLDLLPQAGPSDILGAYDLAIARGLRVSSHVHDGFWHDLGSPAQLYTAHREVLELPGDEAQKLLNRVGVIEFARASGGEVIFVPRGRDWQDPGGLLTMTGPACLTGSAACAVKPWAAALPSKLHLGPLVVAEAGFHAGPASKFTEALVMRSARIDQSPSHKPTVYDHNHVITL